MRPQPSRAESGSRGNDGVAVIAPREARRLQPAPVGGFANLLLEVTSTRAHSPFQDFADG